jgi:arabinogalactan endo-1,4-beta-galactosidase
MKAILGQWEKGVRAANAARKEKTLTIMHFASAGSNDSNYFYSLYQIIIKLKEALKLKQSVDLLEENIRKFFAYWLDIVSAEVEKQQVIYCAQEIYHKVVIVIEAVDRFTDQETGKEANIAFWLP